jgi:hypothetical protein
MITSNTGQQAAQHCEAGSWGEGNLVLLERRFKQEAGICDSLRVQRRNDPDATIHKQNSTPQTHLVIQIVILAAPLALLQVAGRHVRASAAHRHLGQDVGAVLVSVGGKGCGGILVWRLQQREDDEVEAVRLQAGLERLQALRLDEVVAVVGRHHDVACAGEHKHLVLDLLCAL